MFIYIPRCPASIPSLFRASQQSRIIDFSPPTLTAPRNAFPVLSVLSRHLLQISVSRSRHLHFCSMANACFIHFSVQHFITVFDPHQQTHQWAAPITDAATVRRPQPTGTGIERRHTQEGFVRRVRRGLEMTHWFLRGRSNRATNTGSLIRAPVSALRTTLTA